MSERDGWRGMDGGMGNGGMGSGEWGDAMYPNVYCQCNGMVIPGIAVILVLRCSVVFH